jgi:glycine betaine/proline transport system substrate-binding protein
MKKYLLLLMLLFTVFLAACTDRGTNETILFGGGDWDSLRFHNGIAQKILEDGYGYPTDEISGSTSAVIQGLRQGEVHVYMELWPDTSHELYQAAVEAGEVETVGINFDDTVSGTWVPTYVIEGDEERGIEPIAPDLRTVEDLKDYPELFQDPEDPSKGRFYNGPSAWNVSEIIEEKFYGYGLDEMYNLFSPGSQGAMLASLESAYSSGEPWVGYTWSPTATTAMYDLTVLEEAEYDEEIWQETKLTAHPSQTVLILVNHEFPEQEPEVIEFLENYSMTSPVIEEGVSYMIDNNADADEAAIWFLQTYEDIWTEWVSDEIAQNVIDSL